MQHAQPPPAGLGMQHLPADALQTILSRLDFVDLLAAASSCRLLHAAAAPHSHLWHAHCRRRWAGPLNAALYPASHAAAGAAATDWRRLLLDDNGWAAPALHLHAPWAGSRWEDELVSLQPAADDPNSSGDGSAASTIAVASQHELRLLELPDGPGKRLRTLRAARHSPGAGAGELWSSVVALQGDAVAAGGAHGRVALFRLPEHSSEQPAPAAVQPSAMLPFPGSSAVVSQLHYLPAHGRLAVLHDALAALREGQRGALSLVDATTWIPVSPALRDALDGYELAAAAPLGSSGAEFVAGSVRVSDDQALGWECQRCHPSMPASLCFHKAAASTAALCLFDVRSPQPLVARYATHHRSLYPRLQPLRGHFLLTSHAGTPVAVWDSRQMNGPVHEVQHIPRQLDAATAAALPLGDLFEHDPPACQALHLSATPGAGAGGGAAACVAAAHNLLLGRSDNGMCWLFDLSERMGWADGSQRGSWLRGTRCRSGAGGLAAGREASERHADAEAAAQAFMDERDAERAPLPLGVIGAPYEVWCSEGGGAAPLHWLPPAAAWVTADRVVALGGLELDDKQALFPRHAHGSPYPSNALVVASLQRQPG